MHSVITTLMGAATRAACALPELPEKSAERRIATLLSQSGYRLTDDFEREIFQQILGGDRPLHPEAADASQRLGAVPPSSAYARAALS
jgi:hypothetical protein